MKIEDQFKKVILTLKSLGCKKVELSERGLYDIYYRLYNNAYMIDKPVSKEKFIATTPPWFTLYGVLITKESNEF